MKLLKNLLATHLIFSLVFLSFLTVIIPSVSAQNSSNALQRGYRTGYSDGFMAGYRDTIENVKKSYARHTEYKSANRAFNKDYGSLTDYKDGYQQGFEAGYDAGFSKSSFNATIPLNLSKRGVVDVKTLVEKPQTVVKVEQTTKIVKIEKPKIEKSKEVVKTKIQEASQPLKNNVADKINTNLPPNPTVKAVKAVKTTETVSISVDDTSQTVTSTSNNEPNTAPKFSKVEEKVRSIASGGEIVIIPAETELIVELLDEIDTKRVREGDAFKAKVIAPYEINGAIIEGRVAKNRRPGKIKRRAELILSFDRIKISETRWSNFSAIIVEILPVKGDNVKRVDNEGEVEGQRPYKKDGMTVGASTGTGLIIGAVVGGPVGAAVGAGVGAAFGVGAALVERGKYIKLHQQQQLRIKTAYETQIR